MPQIVDYSFNKPALEDVKAAGYVGIARYLAPLPNPKVLTKPEADHALGLGLTITLVWESFANRASQGYYAGKADADAANAQADALGAPDSMTLYFAVDFDATPDAIDPYFQGVKAESKRPIGPYGSFKVVEDILDRGFATKAWQTAAWSNRLHSTRASLYQRVGYVLNDTCDANDVLQADYGQWSNTPVASKPPTPTAKGKDEMFLFQVGIETEAYYYYGTGWIHVNQADATRMVAAGVPLVPGMSDHFRQTLVAKFGQPVG